MNPQTPIEGRPGAADDRLLRVRGTIQGVGFRPFVARLAARFGVRGWVRNDACGVTIRAFAAADVLDRFQAALVNEAPAAARVEGVETETAPASDADVAVTFAIHESAGVHKEVATGVPADLGLCSDCRRELRTTSDRRHGYPFINCTQCGPRYSIIEQLPYDRERTTMRCFRMCPDCQREYLDPTDRRFHAEPNACPVCGPRLYFTDTADPSSADGAEPLARAVAAIRGGRIVAVKGLGGFHLMCDATAPAVVGKLRHRKQRDEKPFAVMFRDVAQVRRYAEVSNAAEDLLQSPQAPIVLVPGRTEPRLAPNVAPGNPWIGALLPSTPLHVRLLEALPFPVVATSGNLAEEPLCTDDEDARARLGSIADAYLGHNRIIARPVDDSVVRFTPRGRSILLRRARGYAPSPLILPGRLSAPVVCVGAHMKNTVAVASGDRVVLSPHIGDLGGAATAEVFARTVDTLGSLFESKPAAVVCDKHPDYTSTRFAEKFGLPRTAVQHHLAHALAVLLEHNHPADDVLAIVWDGTGYGEDGTIWGGEFIHLQRGTARRFGRFRPFRLPGGEAAVRDARRIAFALGYDIGPECGALAARRCELAPYESEMFTSMLHRSVNAPVCCSVGRLFDAAGMLLGVGRHNRFEGQLPLAVEVAATAAADRTDALPFRLERNAGLWEIDWRPAFAALITQSEPDQSRLAAAFHRGLVDAMIAVADQAGARTVALAGGCFQNALLFDLATQQLHAAGHKVITPRILPPNDGAIAAGQALAALWNLTTVELPAEAGAVTPTNPVTTPCA